VAINDDEVVQGMSDIEFMSRQQTGISVVGGSDSMEAGMRPNLENNTKQVCKKSYLALILVEHDII